MKTRVCLKCFVNDCGPEVALHRCSYKKVFWNYAANLQENTHAEMRFRHGYSPVNLLRIFITRFPINTFGGLPLLVYILTFLIKNRNQHNVGNKAKGRNGCFKKAKYAKISEKQTFLTS